MNEELKETVLQVAEYSNEEKTRLLGRMHWLLLAGLIGFAAFLVIRFLNLDTTAPYEAIGSFGLGIAFGHLIGSLPDLLYIVLYSTFIILDIIGWNGYPAKSKQA